jgi:hypothetical protein
MSLDKKAQRYRLRKASKRVLLGETLAEEAARLEKEIAAHPVTRVRTWRAWPFPITTGLEQQDFHPAFRADSCRGIAKKMRRKAKTES